MLCLRTYFVSEEVQISQLDYTKEAALSQEYNVLDLINIFQKKDGCGIIYSISGIKTVRSKLYGIIIYTMAGLICRYIIKCTSGFAGY